MKLAFALALLAVGTALTALGAIHRAPFLAEFRPWLMSATFAGSTAVALAASVIAVRSPRGWTARTTTVATVAGLLALSVTAASELTFLWQRWRVLSADPAILARIGQHVMIGYSDPAEVHRLLDRRAIGGVFLSRRNVAGRTAEAIATEIAGFQAIRLRQNLPRLWIATDQEGGIVSRMSPPLTDLPALAGLVRGMTRPGELDEATNRAVDDYAEIHGRALASLGVNLNFAPVVDLDRGLVNPADAYSRISQRAISSDPAVVAAVAERYCDGLARHGVRCTLKHFPGLGRVFEDTHISKGTLTAGIDILRQTDWVPFIRLGPDKHRFAMVGHVELKGYGLATTSPDIVRGFLRPAWSGPAITDDMCMGPIYWGAGIGSGGVQALKAGLDMLLVSWDGEQVYPLLSALLKAFSGEPIGDDDSQLAHSRLRLRQAMPNVADPNAR